jgi:hypothetical protein
MRRLLTISIQFHDSDFSSLEAMLTSLQLEPRVVPARTPHLHP